MQPQNPLKNLFWLTQVLLTYPPSVTPQTSLKEVITLMHKENSSCVLVLQEDQFIGLITERDIIRCLATPNNPQTLPITEALDQKTITLKDITQLKLDRVINLLLENHFSHLAVLKTNNQPLGVLSAESLLTVILGLQHQVSQLEAQHQERGRIAAALKDVEARYATLVSAAPVGIFRTDVEGHCSYVNERWGEITGLSRQDAMGMGWLIRVHSDDRERITRQWYRSTQTHIPFRSEYRFQHKDGTLIWVLGEAVEERSPNGELIGYIGTITDISDRIQAEEALAKSEATNRALLQALPDMLLRHSRQGTYVDIISSGELKPFISPKELIGKHPEDILPPQVAKIANKALEEALRTNELQTYEYQLQIEDHEWRDYEARVVSTGNGEILSIVRDISERKRSETERQIAEAALQQLNTQLEARVEQRTLALRESEERFRKIFEESPIGMALVGLDYHFLKVNTVLCQMLGYTELELLQLKFDEITHPEDRQMSSQLALELFQGITSSAQIEKRYIKKNGAIVWVNITTCLIHQSDGNPLYALSLIEDISEKKKAEEERKRAEVELKTSLQQKELLLKEVHHRVKNNLQVISSLFSLQSQYIEDSNILSILEDSQNRISSMALIHEKLYQSENLAKIDFKDYIQTLVKYLLTSYNINPQLIHLDLNIEDISLDLDQAIACGLLLNELVSNSLKHAFPTPWEKPGKISINFTIVKKQLFSLKIEDNGIGLPEGLNVKTTPSLGLRLVRALTRQLKGTLEMYNNNGAVFQLIFPQQ
ncbi:signal transduction histidine kinase [Gloeothece citriformis PCC 7424]|uniref:histidine kinase n=1 Tax=Gloeothece citriformis (strain PCC 7424) TaxID=65393 RepID=B7KAF2_GLOC7|nr:PAS domain S-box protein [Gloeothece citriformis]ACK72926.1 signal transduction histidine kinase [Gloeothece citriformis PCC 7424]